MVFTFWVFYATILFFICYMFLMAFEKGKKMLSKEKLMDQIEEKYEDLRKARREMLVMKNNYIILISNITIGRNPVERGKRRKPWRSRYLKRTIGWRN